MRFRRGRQWLLLAALLLLGGCATLSTAQREDAQRIAGSARSVQVDCTDADACALPSRLHDLAERVLAESTPASPRHHAVLLDKGPDALLVRVHLIRSARRSIDLQTAMHSQR